MVRWWSVEINWYSEQSPPWLWGRLIDCCDSVAGRRLSGVLFGFFGGVGEEGVEKGAFLNNASKWKWEDHLISHDLSLEIWLSSGTEFRAWKIKIYIKRKTMQGQSYQSFVHKIQHLRGSCCANHGLSGAHCKKKLNDRRQQFVDERSTRCR